MNRTLSYRLSLGFTVIVTLAAVVTLFGWFGALVNGLGKQPFLALVPWTTLGCVALAAVNCTLRKRLILGGAAVAQS